MNRRATQPGRGFALPLVLLLALAGSMAVAIMMARAGVSRKAVQRQVSGYQLHHTRAGLQEMIEFWASVYVRSAAYGQPEGVWGFDCELDGYTIGIRVEDAQGTPRLDNTHADASLAAVLERAAELYAARTGRPLSSLRTRGASLISINSATPETLECLVSALDPQANGAEFASQVVSRRASGRIDKATDIMDLCRFSGLDEATRHRLAGLLTADSMTWRVRATITDGSGRVVAEQGGVGIGGVRPMGNAASNSWSLLSWGDVTDPGTFAGLPN
jgi:hypothetical protein